MKSISDEDAEFLCGLSTKYLDLQAKNARLKEFARKIIKEYCWGLQIDEPDGNTIKDLAEKLGLIKPRIATEEDVSEFVDYEVGDTIFTFSDILDEDKDNE